MPYKDLQKRKEKLTNAVRGLDLKSHEKEYWEWLVHWWVVRFSRYINNNR